MLIIDLKYPIELCVEKRKLSNFCFYLSGSYKQIFTKTLVSVGTRKAILGLVAAFGTLILTCQAHADVGAITTYSERGQLIRAPMAVTTLGTDLFGDKVNLYSGGLEFVHTDVSLPGNNNLPVAVGRKLSVGGPGIDSGLFREWDLEIPRMHGMFSTKYGWQKINSSGQVSSLRCTNFGSPPEVSSPGTVVRRYRPTEYWHGNFLYVPGQGDQEVLRRNVNNNDLPTDGQSTPLVTKQNWAIRCLSSLASTTNTTPANESGEGFLAISPDGTQYRFDWLVSRQTVALTKLVTSEFSLASSTTKQISAVPSTPSLSTVSDLPSKITPAGIGGGYYSLPRTEVWILPTVITDRFGNTVTYTYDTTDKWKLLNIHSSDNRTITFQYVPGTHQIQSVNDGTRTWTYGYSVVPSTKTMLTTVTLPDNSAWQLAGLDGGVNYQGVAGLEGLIDMQLKYRSDPSSTPNAECDGFIGDFDSPIATGTMIHPSGAIGSFTMTPTQRGRNGVPQNCFSDGVPNSPPTAYFARTFDNYSLTKKTISGPGMPTMNWTTQYDGFNPGWSDCTSCNAPSIVSVTDPKGDVTRYTFGSTFQVNEGQLQKIDIGWNGSTALRTTTIHYNTSFTQPVGDSDQDRGDGGINTRRTPEDLKVTTQQGVTFTWQVPTNSDFDNFARAKKVTRSSSLNSTRTETTVYSDNLSKWILGAVASVTDVGTGLEMVKNTYDPANMNLLTTTRFGHLDQTLSYNADGTLATRKDGLNQTTTYSNYNRGLAQNIVYPNRTTESAVVENRGLITSRTDQLGYTTNYGYETIGRLNRISFPLGDNVTWNDSTIVLESVAGVEFGLSAGHWRQTISTGDARTVTYLDALWRPVLKRTFDNSNPGSTSQMVLQKFDHQGQAIYTSYPQRDISSINLTPPGTQNIYDALGRLSSTAADSELGTLTTNIYYLNGFQKQVVNPRGLSTTTSYQVFDVPSENAPIAVAAPEGLSVVINRDTFSKSLAISRTGSGISSSRNYVYDANQRLCKTLEPETGATIQAYDAANNVQWSATGLALPNAASCDTASVPATNKITYGYDSLNRLTSTAYADGSASITRTYTQDGLPETVSTSGANPSVWTSYYNRRRLLTQDVLNFASQNYSINYRYDSNAHLDQLTYPNGKIVATVPNALGQASQVGSFATNITYHPNGAIAGFSYGNGIIHSLTQNTRGLPLQSKDIGILQDTYDYDQNANVLSITDNTANNTSRSMSYDNLDRLKTTNAPGIWGSASYEYDALDNITKSIVGSRTNIHTYDTAKNRLTSIASNISNFNYSYTYDGQGNVSQRGSQGFTFDQGNRLVTAQGKASYVYDGLGHRIKTLNLDGSSLLQIYNPAGQFLYSKQSGGANNGKETTYIYLNRHVIAEVAK